MSLNKQIHIQYLIAELCASNCGNVDFRDLRQCDKKIANWVLLRLVRRLVAIVVTNYFRIWQTVCVFVVANTRY
jgi:hypothetical protein